MEQFAKPDGSVDREAFTAILDALRRQSQQASTSGVEFQLTAQIVRAGGQEGLMAVTAPSNFMALGLSLRYNVPVKVSLACLENIDENGGLGLEQLQTRFPGFRSMQTLRDDAQAVDGAVSDWFFQGKKPPQAFE